MLLLLLLLFVDVVALGAVGGEAAFLLSFLYAFGSPDSST